MSTVADAKVARRYAAALFSTARKVGKTERVQHDLGLLDRLWLETPTLQRVMESPLVPHDRKHELVDRVFIEEVDVLTRGFLHLLVEKRREAILPVVGREYVRLADIERGLVRAEALVAAPIDDLQRAALVESLERRTGKQVELAVRLDPAVIGGVVVRMHDTVIDGSVRGALERLREEMLHER